MLYAGSDPIAEAEIDQQTKEFSCKCVRENNRKHDLVTITGTAEDDVTDLNGTLHEKDETKNFRLTKIKIDEKHITSNPEAKV